MLKKSVVATGLLFFFLYLLTALRAAAADVDSSPTQLYGYGDIRAVAVSPDRRFMATGGQGGAFLWDFQTGELFERLEAQHEWSVTALAFSPDSNILLTATRNQINVINAETGAHLRFITAHNGDITRLKFSPDGQTFFSASGDNTTRQWSVATGQELRSFRAPGSPITDITISPDGQKLATLDTFLTNCIKIWDIPSQTFIRAIPKTNWTAQGIHFAPDGNLVVTAPDRSVTLWNIDTAQPIRSFGGITNPIAIAYQIWNPTTNTLAATCSDGRVLIWNFQTAELLHSIPGEAVLAVASLENAAETVAVGIDYVLRHRVFPQTNVIRQFVGHTTSSHGAVAFSPDGRFALSGGIEPATRLWNRKTGELIRTFVGGGAGTMAAQFSPNGSNILTTIGLPNPAAQLWDTDTGDLIREFKWNASWPMGATFSPDGTKVAARAQDSRIRIFNTGTGALIQTLIDEGWGGALDFSPNAPLLIAASANDTAKLYNHETGQLLHTFSANAGPVIAARFSPKGETILIAWQDGVIHLFNSFTMELRRQFFGSAAFLEDAVFSPDGQFILTGEGWPQFTATIWDSQTGERLRSFTGHRWSVDSVAFSRNGTSILTGADVVRAWDIQDLAARLRIQNSKLTWSIGQLQQAPSVNGPWQTLTNASPFTPPATPRFYRVKIEEAQ